MLLPPHQTADHQDVRQIEDDAGGEGRGVEAGIVVDRAGEPAPAAIPEPLNTSTLGTRHDASDAGNSSRTAST